MPERRNGQTTLALVRGSQGGAQTPVTVIGVGWLTDVLECMVSGRTGEPVPGRSFRPTEAPGVRTLTDKLPILSRIVWQPAISGNVGSGTVAPDVV
jgi:hypothetical protein